MVNWRLLIGQAADRIQHGIAKRLPPVRAIPHGNWLYDLRRFGGPSIGPILDVGANVGQTAWGLTRYFPSDPIYCFEPVSSSFAELERRYGDKVTCIQSALGSEPGSAEIMICHNSELNTMAAPGSNARTGAIGRETIQLDTLDAFVERSGLDRVGLLKMDVQGWELEVLRGGANTIKDRKVRFIFTEVGFSNEPGSKDMLPLGEIQDHLFSNGYLFAGLYDQFRWGPKKQYVGFANALFVLGPPDTANPEPPGL